jgi:hypothetical protein
MPPFKKRAINKNPVANISHGMNKFLSAFTEGCFGNPAIPEIWDPWLSAPRLLEVWLYRLSKFKSINNYAIKMPSD